MTLSALLLASRICFCSEPQWAAVCTVVYTEMSNAMLRYATPRHATPCHAMPCHAMPCHAMLCYATHPDKSLLMASLTISGTTCVGLTLNCFAILHTGRAAWENAKDATVDTGRYLAGRGSAVANGDNRSAGMYTHCCLPLQHSLTAPSLCKQCNTCILCSCLTWSMA